MPMVLSYIYLLKKWIAITSVVEGGVLKKRVLLRKVWCVRLFLSPPLSVSFAFCSPRMLTRALHNSALLAPYTGCMQSNRSVDACKVWACSWSVGSQPTGTLFLLLCWKKTHICKVIGCSVTAMQVTASMLTCAISNDFEQHRCYTPNQTLPTSSFTSGRVPTNRVQT